MYLLVIGWQYCGGRIAEIDGNISYVRVYLYY